MNEEELIGQTEDERGFFMWLAEAIASHPSLAHRVRQFKEFTAG